MLYTIKKGELYVKDFTDGVELTRSKRQAEYYYSKKGAIEAAIRYGRKNGKGYKVVEA